MFIERAQDGFLKAFVGRLINEVDNARPRFGAVGLPIRPAW
jgi:hypothetical protein